MPNRYDNHENSSGCSYANLSHYNNGSKGTHHRSVHPGTYTVPAFDSIGYDSLTHKEYSNSCCGNPYPNIRAAYKTHDGNCKQDYTTMDCNR
jgi:hypothetical protein